MALISTPPASIGWRSERCAVLLAVSVVLPAVLVAGCAARQAAPAPVQARAVAETSTSRWESFDGTVAVLWKDIDRRAEALRSGPIGSRAAELASLRLAASAHELIDAGSLDGAREAADGAVSLYARNGYACLFLAYVHHEQGRPVDAREQASCAGRYLPNDGRVRAELDALLRAIRSGAAGRGRNG